MLTDGDLWLFRIMLTTLAQIPSHERMDGQRGKVEASSRPDDVQGVKLVYLLVPWCSEQSPYWVMPPDIWHGRVICCSCYSPLFLGQSHKRHWQGGPFFRSCLIGGGHATAVQCLRLFLYFTILKRAGHGWRTANRSGWSLAPNGGIRKNPTQGGPIALQICFQIWKI